MLWDKIKHLTSLCPIYKNYVDEDTVPTSYVLLIEEDFDELFIVGDSSEMLRKRSFTITIRSKDNSQISTIVSAYRNVLFSNSIRFTQSGPVYEPLDGYISVLITGGYLYEVT